jgi:hypothetical protein
MDPGALDPRALDPRALDPRALGPSTVLFSAAPFAPPEPFVRRGADLIVTVFRLSLIAERFLCNGLPKVSAQILPLCAAQLWALRSSLLGHSPSARLLSLWRTRRVQLPAVARALEQMNPALMAV